MSGDVVTCVSKVVPQEFSQNVLDELRTGEHIKWLGMPDPKRSAIAMTSSAATGLFFFVGLLLSLLTMVNSDKFDAVAAAFSLVFFGTCLTVTLWTTLSPIMQLYRSRKTVHAITNQRIITVVYAWPKRIKIISPKGIVKIKSTVTMLGRGDLMFDLGDVRDSDGWTKNIVTWHGIDGIQEAEAAIIRMRNLDG
jgi:hypothetical protein